VLSTIGSENVATLQVLDQKNTQLEQIQTNFMSGTKTLGIDCVMNIREGLNTPSTTLLHLAVPA